MELPQKLSEAKVGFSRLPGVGEKSALRHVLHVMNWSREEIKKFSQDIYQLSNIEKCLECGIYKETGACLFCENPKRLASESLCVVENISECIAIDRSGHFNGLYFILGGVLNPLLGIGPEEIRLNRLLLLIQTKEIKTVILAVNSSVEGDATCSYIREILPEKIHVDRIGFGIPMGGSLEYLDPLTISKALENKRTFN